MPKRFAYGLVAVLMIAATVLTACSSAAPTPTVAAPGGQPAATQAPSRTQSASGGNGQVEVFSWWVGSGEADGLAAMVKIFEQKYPNEQFVNAAVAGGAGTNAKAVLATRHAAGDPPDSW